mgnify:FL=1
MAVIKKDYNASSLPISFSRGNPQPLDKSAVWYDFEALTNYAKQGATAYVGQVLAYVNETDNTAKAYIIADAAGTLVEVGAATLGDDKTITLEEGTLALKSWGKEYYRWVDAVGEEGQEGYVAGHHEKQVVDGEHPWIAGLEPKAIAGTDGTFELAWYQPSTTTVEGLSSTVSTIRTAVDEINKALGDAKTENTIRGDIAGLKETVEGKLDTAGGTLTGNLTLADGSKAASEKVVDTKVAEAIGSAGHLKRLVVEQLPDIADADVDTIYMVKDASVTSGDAYKEYMVIDGAFAQIGDTTVNLDPYVKKAVPAAANNIAVLGEDGALIDGGTTIAALKSGIEDDYNGKLADKVDVTEGKSLVDDTLITKLGALANIKTIGANLTLSEAGELSAQDSYELPVATDAVLGGVKIGSGVEATAEGVLSAKVKTGNGLSLGADGIEMGTASADAAGAMSSEMFLKLSNIEAEAQKNVVVGALIGTDTAEINEDKKIVVPVATADNFGVVKSAADDNKVAVGEDGTMTINKVGVSKLTNEEGTELVLNCGNA